jgi:hypothetical protein
MNKDRSVIKRSKPTATTILPETINYHKKKTTSPYVEYGVGEGVSAYFIEPGGRWIIVNTSHVDKVIQDPEYFGFAFSDIEALHNKFHEKLGVEGKARSIILRTLIRNGWIHARYNVKLDLWNFTVWTLGRREKKLIDKWVAEMFTYGLVSLNTEYVTVALVDDSAFASLE